MALAAVAGLDVAVWSDIVEVVSGLAVILMTGSDVVDVCSTILIE